MKKWIIIGLALVFYVPSTFSQTHYDKSKHYQWRSMEDGPWKFDPKAYYYSWNHKKVLGVKIPIPGMGIHDNGPAGSGIGGDHYVKRYSPNQKFRVETVGTTALETPKYDEQREAYKNVRILEDRLTLDRTMNIASMSFDERITKISDVIIGNLIEYAKSANDREKNVLENCLSNLRRIHSNIKLIGKSYVSNIKKSEAYRKEVAALYDLNQGVSTLLKLQYNRIENQYFFLKDK